MSEINTRGAGNWFSHWLRLLRDQPSHETGAGGAEPTQKLTPIDDVLANAGKESPAQD